MNLKKESQLFKAGLIASIATHIASYEAKTGLNVKSLDVNFIDEKLVGSESTRYTLSGVAVDVDI